MVVRRWGGKADDVCRHSYDPTVSATSPAPASPAILRESPEWLALDKPVGWHCAEVAHSDGAPTIVAWLCAERPELAALTECGLVHRLDRETSGCLLVARNERSRTRLRAALSGRGSAVTRKRYLALAAPGLAPTGEFTLWFTSRHPGSAKVTVSDRGEPAACGSCRWRVMRAAQRASSEAASRSPVAVATHEHDLIEIELLGPGRRHQIRAGLAHLGHPLAGDILYRGRPAVDRNGAVIGAALHAASLVVDGVTIAAPAPAWAR